MTLLPQCLKLIRYSIFHYILSCTYTQEGYKQRLTKELEAKNAENFHAKWIAHEPVKHDTIKVRDTQCS